jgi:hypothetical protein
MCRIGFSLNIDPGDGADVESIVGKIIDRNTNLQVGNSFNVDVNDPRTPILPVGVYRLSVTVSNNLGGTSEPVTADFRVSENCEGGPLPEDNPIPTGCRRYNITNETGVSSNIPFVFIQCLPEDENTADPDEGGGLGGPGVLAPNENIIICANLAGSGIELGINEGVIIEGFSLQDLNQPC